MSELKTIQREALGRVHELGSLYNIKTDQFVHGNIIIKREGKNVCTVTPVNIFDLETSSTEKLTDRFSSLKLNGETVLSVFGGLVKVEGAASYLHENTDFENSVQFSLIQKQRTSNEELNLYDKDLKKYIGTNFINSEVTHIVIRIERGANVCMSVKYNLFDSKQKEEIKGNLRGEMEKFKIVLKAAIAGEKSSKNFTKNTGLEIKIHADVAPPQFTAPQTLEEAINTFKEIHQCVTRSEGKQGIPLTYYLLDVREFIRIFNLTISYDSIYKEIRNKVVANVINMIDRLAIQSQQVQDLKKDVQNKAIPPHLQQGILTYCEDCEKEERSIRESLVQLLPKARSEDEEAETSLLELPFKFNASSLSEEKITKCYSDNKAAVRGISLFKLLTQKKIFFLDGQDDFNSFRHNQPYPILILFYSLTHLSDDDIWRETLDIFIKQSESGKYRAVAFCTDGREEVLQAEKINESNKIAIWENNTYVIRDLYNDVQKLKHINFAYPIGNFENLGTSFKNTVYARFRCPNLGCNLEKENYVKWTCKKCCDVLEYDVKQKVLICMCGSMKPEQFTFKCGNKGHGDAKVDFCDNITKDLARLAPYPQTNILIIGETGVGKSTFINSTACYIMFPSLEEAEKNNLLVLIPFSFDMEIDGIPKEFKSGSCENERTRAGESSTKYPKPYYFKTEDHIFCFIDTPGIGDTLGAINDKENMQNIMTFLNSEVDGEKLFEELHLICILVNSGTCRLTEAFKYCYTELMMQFHRSAISNIVFCLTKSSGHLYKSGDTGVAITQLFNDIVGQLNTNTLSSIKCKPFELKEDFNIFMVDNISYRYLAITDQLKDYIDADQKAQCSVGFNTSREKIMKMMQLARTIRPHIIQDSQYVHMARKTITTLSGPLLKIATAVRKTMDELDEKEAEINEKKMTMEQLRSKLYQPIKRYSVKKELERTVSCERCITIKEIRDGERQNYIEADPWMASQDPIIIWFGGEVKKNSLGEYECPKHGTEFPRKIGFAAFYKDYSDEKKLDEEVKQKLDRTSDDCEKIAIWLEEKNKFREALQKEEKAIQKASAIFALFLRHHSLKLFNDSTEAYLNICLSNEVETGYSGGKRWKLLKTMLDEYKLEVKCIEEQIGNKDKAAIDSITPTEILKLVEELKILPHYGNDVVQAFTSRSNEWKPSVESNTNVFKSSNNPSRLCNNIKYVSGFFGF